MHRAFMLACLALLAACSMRTAIDALTSPEDRAFAQGFVDKVRRGESASLEPMFDGKLWQESVAQLAQAARLYPPSLGTTELIAYHVNTNMANGTTTSTKTYTLVTHDDTHWTTTVIRTQAAGGGPHRIIGWNVNGSGEMPMAYRQYQAMESMAKGFQIGAAIALALVVALVIWLVRRSRRRRGPLAGRIG